MPVKRDEYYNFCKIKPKLGDDLFFTYRKHFECGCYYDDDGYFGKHGNFIPNLYKKYTTCEMHKKQLKNKEKTWEEILKELKPIDRRLE